MPLVALLCGFLFSSGIVISGMVKPAKVLAFLDLFGSWDPSLMFVMVGAIGVHAACYWYFKPRLRKPLLENAFFEPKSKLLDKKLITGAALFGIGWGLAGYCPGPAFISLLGASSQAWLFFAAMLAGMFAASRLQNS
jgi:uncharacterized protein